MRKLRLHDIHESLGALFREAGEVPVPAAYGDSTAEYEAVRNKVGIIDMSDRGKLRLSGKEHLKFLQGMLTNDVIKLEEGKGMYAAVLTVKGRMLSDMNVYREPESVLLDLEPGLNEKVEELLKKFRLSYKAQIDDITDDLGLISVHGPNAGKLVSSISGVDVSGLEELSHKKARVDTAELLIVKINRTGEEGLDVYAPSDSIEGIWSVLMDNGKELGVKPVGLDAYNTLRIEAGIPIYGADMDEETIPIEAGIWRALNFEKGCYVGQEVVARIKWRGHVNRHLMGLTMAGEDLPASGDEIFAGEKKIGRITSSVFSPALGRPVALGYVRREFKSPGTEVIIKVKGELSEKAKVSELPFYSRESGTDPQ